MRTSILASAVMATTLVMAKPIEKRVMVTMTDVFTVYTTITEGDAQAETAAAEQFMSTVWGRHHTHTTSSSSEAASSTTVVVSTPTTSSTPTSTVAPAPSTTSTSTEAPSSTSTVEPTTSAEPTTTAVAVASTTAASSSAAASSTASSSYQGIVLDQHNLHRANHSVASLTWNDTLAATALKIAESCVYAHDTTMDGGGYGQNIGAGASPDQVGAMITNEMYNGEIGYYPLPFGANDPDMTNFENWGHFSQIVWADTTTIGCATYQCSTLENVSSDVEPYFTVCNYGPPGNYAGEYSNVQAPLGDATVTVSE